MTCLNGTQIKVRILHYLYYTFSIDNDLKQGDVSSPLLFNFALEYTTVKVQENSLELDMNGTHQVLNYVHDINLTFDDIGTLEKNASVSLNAYKYTGLVWKTKYAEVRRQGMMQVHIIFKY